MDADNTNVTGDDKGKNVVNLIYVMIPDSSARGEKPEKFNGTHFRRWQQKILFYLTTRNLTKFLKEEVPASGSSVEAAAAADAWYLSGFLCKNYILNGLENALYNLYSPMKSVKALWQLLDKKYKTEDVGKKKYIIGRFLDYKMIDSKSVMSQLQEFQLIIHEMQTEKNYLKHAQGNEP